MFDSIIAVAAAVLALLSLIAQFYMKWVPDAKDQKRHLKRVGFWLWNVSVFAILGFDFYLFSREKGPINAGFVLNVAAVTGLTALYATLLVIKYLVLSLMLGREDGLVPRGLLSVIDGMVRAFETLSSDPNLSDETVQKLRRIIYGADGPHPRSKQQSDPNPVKPGAPRPDFGTYESKNPHR